MTHHCKLDTRNNVGQWRPHEFLQRGAKCKPEASLLFQGISV